VSQPLRVALIGLDHWYTAISLAERFTAHPDVELVGIADPDADRVHEVLARAGVSGVSGSADDFLADDSIDLIASFVSTERNPAVCVTAARNGKHILSVKPLARTLDQATEIVQAVRNAGVTFLGAESRGRHSAHQQQLRTWIAEGRFGKLLTASYSMWATLPQGWPGSSEPGWFVEAERTPGGAWIDHSIYQLDQLRWLTGARVAKVSGTVANLKYGDLSVEDYGLALVEFDNGLLAQIEDTWTAVPGGGRTAMSIVGTDGAVTYDTLTGRLSLAGDLQPFAGWVHRTPETMHSGAIDELVATVRGKQDPISTVEDAWDNLAACEAFYQAATTGTPVTPKRLPTS
jgi:predicted dehydrogenase